MALTKKGQELLERRRRFFDSGKQNVLHELIGYKPLPVAKPSAVNMEDVEARIEESVKYWQ